MTLYDFLSTPLPTIAYCALHQSLPSIEENEYVATMRELHKRIFDESETLHEGYAQSLSSAVARETQTLQSSLREFLHTPIRSDEEEVRGRIGESLDRFKEQLTGSWRQGLLRSREGKISFPSSKHLRVKQLLHNGKEYLEGLGFSAAGTPGRVFESMFVIEGGQNLDVLEHIVRDKLGIYATTHGKHIKEFGDYAYAAHNQVYEWGTIPSADQIPGRFEAALFFSKPSPDTIKYASFRNKLSTILDRLVNDTKVDHVSVWQRKLGLGAGAEFVIRILCPSTDSIEKGIELISGYKDTGILQEVLMGKGRLVMKQLLF